MSTPHIDQVRSSLLETLADLRNKEHPMDIDRARAVAQVAGVLVDTAKVEVDYIKATGQDRSVFLEQPPADTALPTPNGIPQAHNPFPRATVHRLQG